MYAFYIIVLLGRKKWEFHSSVLQCTPYRPSATRTGTDKLNNCVNAYLLLAR